MRYPTRTSNISFLSVFALVLVLSVPPILAQGEPFLVKDINPSGSSTPTELVSMNGFTFFAADDGVNGIELWKSDGTTVGTTMVKNICSPACSSSPYQLTVAALPAGDRLFFTAYTGSTGFELWMSDGTETGTVLVEDIESGAGSSGVDKLTAAGSLLFFRAFDPVVGLELWKSDGTPGGTTVVKEIFEGAGQSTPSELVAVGPTLFFSALSSGIGRELWKSDGTELGTVNVEDISWGVASSNPIRLAAVGNTLFFVATTGGYGYELWKSDGTAAGTSQVRNIKSGSASSFPDHLTALGAEVYFVADDGTDGAELWKSDGTYFGTVQVKDVFPGGVSSQAADLKAVGNVLFFSAEDNLLGRELWTSDGTTLGTQMVQDINSGASHSSPSELQDVDGSLLFSADDGLVGFELWASDGTENGTGLIGPEINLVGSSNPTEPTPTQSLVLFAADDGVTGRELWALQTGAGPVLEFAKLFNDAAAETGTSGHTFSLTVTNSGSGPATLVRITDPVDPRLTVTSVSPPTECVASSGQYVDCTFPTLGDGAFETVIVTYSIGAGVTPANGVLNTAQVGSFETPLIDADDTVDICEGEINLSITDPEISGPYTACLSISADGPTVTVRSGEAASLSAPLVIFNADFAVESGAELTVGSN